MRPRSGVLKSICQTSCFFLGGGGVGIWGGVPPPPGNQISPEIINSPAIQELLNCSGILTLAIDLSN